MGAPDGGAEPCRGGTLHLSTCCLPAPAASWTLAHSHLLPARPPAPAEQHRELTPSRWSHFRRWEQMKGKTKPNPAPASLACTRPLCVLPPASLKTAHPPSAPFSCPNSQKGREGVSLLLWELGSGWKAPSDPAQEQVSALKAEIHPCT